MKNQSKENNWETKKIMEEKTPENYTSSVKKT